MGLFDLITNTTEGVLQTALGATKAAVGSVTAVLDEGETLDSGLDNISDGIKKIGKSEKDK